MEKASPTILIVDDELSVRNVCREILERAGFRVATAGGLREARKALAVQAFALVVADVHLAGDDGVELAREIKTLWPGTEVVVMTGHSDVPTAVAALKTGAADYLEKPFSPEQLVGIAHDSRRRRRKAAVASRHQEVELAKGAMLSRMSHELRTPVAVAKAACDILKPRLPGEDERRVATRLESGLNRLRDRIEEILAFGAASGEPRLADVDLKALLAAAAASCEAEARARRILLALELPAVLRSVCDAGKIRTTAVELIRNAVRFSPAGSEVRVHAEESEAAVELRFCDRGPGIPPAERERVFESFYQTADTLTRETPGLGLGLATARRVVDAHGGTIEILERTGGGTLVRIVLQKKP